jgi:SAM-dependent methyltransferase
MTVHGIVNTEQAEAWNGYEGRHWAEHADQWNATVSPVNDPLLTAAAIQPRHHVLDIGCGTGQTTRLAATRAHGGQVIGIDLSAPMLAAARAAAARHGITNAHFVQGDAQVHPFTQSGFDVAISRGAIMFFNDPVAAFTNIRQALRPGGRLAFVCPRRMEDNTWFTVPVTALLGRLPMPAPYEPGMFSFAHEDHIHDLLTRSGFHAIGTAPVTVPMIYGNDAADAAAFFLSTGPARHHLRDADPPTLHRALETLTAAIRPHEGPDGTVRFTAAWWLATAQR